MSLGIDRTPDFTHRFQQIEKMYEMTDPKKTVSQYHKMAWRTLVQFSEHGIFKCLRSKLNNNVTLYDNLATHMNDVHNAIDGEVQTPNLPPQLFIIDKQLHVD